MLFTISSVSALQFFKIPKCQERKHTQFQNSKIEPLTLRQGLRQGNNLWETKEKEKKKKT